MNRAYAARCFLYPALFGWVYGCLTALTDYATACAWLVASGLMFITAYAVKP